MVSSDMRTLRNIGCIRKMLESCKGIERTPTAIINVSKSVDNSNRASALVYHPGIVRELKIGVGVLGKIGFFCVASEVSKM